MAIFNNPGDSIISSGGNIVGVDLVRKDVPNSNQGGNTIVYEGYTPEACTLSEITVFMKTLNTQGTYTATFTNVTTGNTVLSTANFNMQTLSANTWTTLTLTGTASDLSFAADDRFTVSFASNNTSFDGAGVYFTMRFTAASSFTPRAMDLIFGTTLTSTAHAVSTGTLPTGYSSYLVTIRARSDRASGNLGAIRMYFNNDLNDANYQSLRNDTAGQSSGFRTLNAQQAGSILTPSAGGDASFFGSAEVRVLSPESTTGYKSYQIISGMHSSATDTNLPTYARVNLFTSSIWRNTNPITVVTFKNHLTEDDGSSCDFEVGSTFKVYGIR